MNAQIATATILETPRMWLRCWQAGDADPYATMNLDPEVMTFLRGTRSHDESLSHITDYRASLERHGYGNLVAEHKETGQFIGCIGLSDVPDYVPIAPAVDIGWRLRREFWGQGLASEGAKACLDHGLEHMGLKRIIAYTAEANLRSIRVIEKLGMSHAAHCDFDHPLMSATAPYCRQAVYEVYA